MSIKIIKKLNKAFNNIDQKETFILSEIKKYANDGKTEFYICTKNDNTMIAVLIDYDICNENKGKSDYFSYSEITSIQNFYMFKYDKTFRFLIEDIDSIENLINDSSIALECINKTADRQLLNSDFSPLEYKFEESFINVYGRESLKYLDYEYPISTNDGHCFYLDFLLNTKRGRIAIEENGISFHHPQTIGIVKYRLQLLKQNTCTLQNIKIYRFSTEDLMFAGNIEDNIYKYLGEKSQFLEKGTKANRGFLLYKHQNDTLVKINEYRKKGIGSFLVVSPTASGKSEIAVKDIEQFKKENKCEKILIIVPSNILENDWIKRIEKLKYKNDFQIMSYQYLIRHYIDYSKSFFDYIVVDEAHHFVAPITKRMVQYFTPKFMLGLTATPERLDEKRLEEVFGTYETTLSLAEAMKKKIIANARVFRLETNLDLSKIRINGKDYINADLEKKVRIDSRNDLIASVILKYFNSGRMKNLQGLVFCVNQNHANEVSKILNDNHISSASYVSNSMNQCKIMDDFIGKKIRFLCVCDKVNEGWDYPELGILIMARPTLSKSLYIQQLGRGLRRTDNKNEVYVIDVVDQYGASIVPCSMHSIFKRTEYVAFGDILSNYQIGEFITIDGYSEEIRNIIPIDIETFEDKYKEYLNQQQLAIELFVGDQTVNNWILKRKVIPDANFKFGNKNVYLFKKINIPNIRIRLGLKEHNNETIKEDFFDFLEERDYTFSYKMPFLKSVIKNLKSDGEAKIDEVLNDYINFYKNRIKKKLIIDKENCPYNKKTLEDKKFIQKNMLTNPFEKFERKKFMYYSKDIGIIQINANLIAKLTKEDFIKINKQMDDDLVAYYNKLRNK